MQATLNSYVNRWFMSQLECCINQSASRKSVFLVWSMLCVKAMPCNMFSSCVIKVAYPSISEVLRTVSVKALIYSTDHKISETQEFKLKMGHTNITWPPWTACVMLKRASGANFAQKWTSAQTFLEVCESQMNFFNNVKMQLAQE